MAIAAGIVLTLVGAGVNYALRPEQPDSPDLAGASRGQIEAEAETLAQRRALESAAQQGGTAVKAGYTKTTQSGQQRAALEKQIASLQQTITRYGGSRVPAQQQRAERARNSLAGLQDQLANIPEGGGTVYVDKNGRMVPASEALVSFEGYGEADVQGKLARQMAEIELELSKKYGKDFVEEAKRQLELADPTGTQARKLMYDLVQEQIANEPDRPVADLLDAQVGEQLRAGKGLDRVSQEMLDQAIKESQGSRGESGRGGDFAENLTTGFEGQRRLDAGQQKALGWLTSGATPEDVDYRREQQNLANLAAFSAGRTPQSQFGTLSGAQRGATPNMPGQPLAQMQGSGQAGASGAMQGWNIQQNAALNTASGWMTGLSALLGAGNVAGAAGWQPLARTA